MDQFLKETNMYNTDSNYCAECFDVLGIENNLTIQDCQITASSYLNDSYTPQMARLNSDSGWAPAIRDMKPYRGNDYIEVREVRCRMLSLPSGDFDCHCAVISFIENLWLVSNSKKQ